MVSEENTTESSTFLSVQTIQNQIATTSIFSAHNRIMVADSRSLSCLNRASQEAGEKKCSLAATSTDCEVRPGFCLAVFGCVIWYKLLNRAMPGSHSEIILGGRESEIMYVQCSACDMLLQAASIKSSLIRVVSLSLSIYFSLFHSSLTLRTQSLFHL